MSPELLSAVIGIFMPAVVEYVKKFTPDKRWISYLVSIIVSLLVGVVTLWVKGTLLLNPEQILDTAATALVVSQTVYIFWFRDSQIAERISK